MNKYNYQEAMYKDINDYMQLNNIRLSEYGDTIHDAFEKLEEELWDEDCITGNGSFGYDTNANCEEYLCHNLDTLFLAIDEFDFDTTYSHLDIKKLPQILDSLIRCYLLGFVLWDYVKDNWEGDIND